MSEEPERKMVDLRTVNMPVYDVPYVDYKEWKANCDPEAGARFGGPGRLQVALDEEFPPTKNYVPKDLDKAIRDFIASDIMLEI